MRAEDVIRLLRLEPLACEGGLYRRTYCCPEYIAQSALPDRYDGPRPFATAIYYLLTPDTCSHLHRLRSDEVFHFYLGGPVTMLLLHTDGRSDAVILGPHIQRGQRLQVVVPNGTWMGLMLSEEAQYALLGTTVAPGYDDADFEAAKRSDLVAKFPDWASLIECLTPPD